MSDNLDLLALLAAKRIHELRIDVDHLRAETARLVNVEQGSPGPKDDKGDRGPKGDKGDRGPMPKHQWKGSKVRFEKPDGQWGPWVDLEGASGAIVVAGGGGADLAHLAAATDELPEGFVVKQAGRYVVASAAQFLGWVGVDAVTSDGQIVTVDGVLVALH